MRFLTLFTAIIISSTAIAKEGMWIPLLLKQLNESEMQSMGYKLTAEDIYSVNQSSMKDAVVKFGGGCTGEIISSNGLLLTNHHCGYGQIQSHSTVENDYLTEGFWAQSLKDELPNTGLTATFIVRIEDVSRKMLADISPSLVEAKRDSIISARISNLTKKATEDTHYDAYIKPFYHGNQYFMFITETFKDIRLVGAPPSSIGKFGFDSDNWMWPRHTGDFSMFRIYADENNKPAEYSEDNVPYQPKHHFPISLNGYEKNDFSMVFGFPASTEEYLPATAVEYTIDKLNPARIEMRDASLEIIGNAMANDKKINIQYAAKQSSISNAWKKWKGQTNGLKNVNAVGKKKELEKQFVTRAKETGKSDWANIPTVYDSLYKVYKPYNFARAMLIEIYYYGPEVLRFANGFEALTKENLSDSALTSLKEKMLKRTKSFFKDYHQPTDQKIMAKLMPMYLNNLNESVRPNEIIEYFNGKKPAEKLYKNSMFDDEEKLTEFIENYTPKQRKKILKDDAFKIAQSLLNSYSNNVRPPYSEVNKAIDSTNRVYMKALQTLLPNYKKYYPDANFTLRLSYGKINGYEPKDGINCSYYTTTDGIIQKMDTTSKEYDVPSKLHSLIQSKDFGQYADENGELRVCFIGQNHTSGGNSGSPAINGEGQLIGLNFDRTWESTMSDIMYDPEICRNIMVDIRYVLFVIDKYAGANRLIDEMELVKN
ncbi:S46 family peptidase [Salibacter halophilus]|nr:S46 family peptidase [Salibacter halophilus]